MLGLRRPTGCTRMRSDWGDDIRVVDLFCGTGGFSRGAHAAGFDVPVAVDIDPILTSSYLANFPDTKLLLRDISTLTGEELLDVAKGQIDGLIGGPPCQGFSLMGHRDSDDPRRDLVDHFYRLVAEVKPCFFVMENVVGLLHGDARQVLDQALLQVESDYRLLGPLILDAADFGVPTRRKRCFVIGVKYGACELPVIEPSTAMCRVTVRDAIKDLLEVSEGIIDEEGFDWFRVGDSKSISDYAKMMRSEDGRTTGNVRTRHKPHVVARFAEVPQGKTDVVGRHQRLLWEGLCPTLRAGTGADRGSYQSVRPLHPSEPRVITVREAARLQGFPDGHLFHPTIWHSFRMIGNSVSPPVAKAILSAISESFKLV